MKVDVERVIKHCCLNEDIYLLHFSKRLLKLNTLKANIWYFYRIKEIVSIIKEMKYENFRKSKN